MDNNNLSKEFKDLINSSGLTLEELLGVAAAHTIKCDECSLLRECEELRAEITCNEIWAGYLMGVKDEA